MLDSTLSKKEKINYNLITYKIEHKFKTDSKLCKQVKILYKYFTTINCFKQFKFKFKEI